MQDEDVGVGKVSGLINMIAYHIYIFNAYGFGQSNGNSLMHGCYNLQHK